MVVIFPVMRRVYYFDSDDTEESQSPEPSDTEPDCEEPESEPLESILVDCSRCFLFFVFVAV